MSDRSLFPELAPSMMSQRGRQRDPFGRYDTKVRYAAYERKIERLRGTIKHLANVMQV